MIDLPSSNHTSHRCDKFTPPKPVGDISSVYLCSHVQVASGALVDNKLQHASLGSTTQSYEVCYVRTVCSARTVQLADYMQLQDSCSRISPYDDEDRHVKTHRDCCMQGIVIPHPQSHLRKLRDPSFWAAPNPTLSLCLTTQEPLFRPV